MCALIAMAVHDTEENNRSWMTKRTLECLLETVDFAKHRLVISDNGSCKETHEIYKEFADRFSASLNATIHIFNNENLGTAEAINKAWAYRLAGQNAIKMDNDVVIYASGWVDEMEEAIRREPLIGICGLKRKDCWEHPKHESPDLRSELIMLPHDGNSKWMVVERANHVMGTCQMYSSALLEKIGYLFQPKLYGYDDVLACHRSHIAGFMNCFLPHIEIDHIDPGATPYQHWKEKHASECTAEMIEVFKGYQNDPSTIYYKPKGL